MKKPSVLITSSLAATLLATSACSTRQEPDWNGEDNSRLCVDRQGNVRPMRDCQRYDDDDDFDGMFFFMYGSTYRDKYPSKYKSYKSKLSKSKYRSSNRYGGVTRGSGGKTGKSFSAGS